MATFWFVLGALSTLAALFVLLPWLRRIPHIGPLPTVAWPVLTGCATLIAAAVGVYLWLGRPDLATYSGASAGRLALASNEARALSAQALGTAGAGSMVSAVASLQARLAKGGGSADDWELLAKSYEFLGRPQEAAEARAHTLPPLPTAEATAAVPAVASQGAPEAAAPVQPALTAESLRLLAEARAARGKKRLKAAAGLYARLAAANQLNAEGWADFADTAAGLRGNHLKGEPETYIARALALDPAQPKALWLQASADEEAGRLTHAIATWRRLAAVLEPDSSDARIVAANLQQDQKLLGEPAGESTLSQTGSTADAVNPAASSATLRGQVTLSNALLTRIASGETLFIVAKSVDAPGPPLAVYRGVVGSWPVAFTLDDNSAMIPGRNLSSATRVTVEARISRSGQALPASGDLAGVSPIVDPRVPQPLSIVIDHVVP